jgi:hypothetical protein
MNQRTDQYLAASPDNRARDAGYELLLPDQLHGAVIVAAVQRGDGQHVQGVPLAERVAEFPGHAQGAAASPAQTSPTQPSTTVTGSE